CSSASVVAARRSELLELDGLERAEKRVDDDQLRCRGGIVRDGERVDELELVVQIVLEPEHDAGAGMQRVEVLLVAALERREDRAATPPPALGEERRSLAQELGARDGRHGPLVQRVLPRQHRAAEPGLPQRVPGALAVRDVEERRDRRLASATREI